MAARHRERRLRSNARLFDQAVRMAEVSSDYWSDGTDDDSRP